MESSKDKRTKALLQPQVSLKQYVVYMKEDANCPTYRCSAGKKTQQNKRTKTNKKPLPKPNNNASLTHPQAVITAVLENLHLTANFQKYFGKNKEIHTFHACHRSHLCSEGI